METVLTGLAGGDCTSGSLAGGVIPCLSVGLGWLLEVTGGLAGGDCTGGLAGGDCTTGLAGGDWLVETGGD